MKKKFVNDSGGISMSFMKKNLLKMKLTFLCLFLSFVQLMANDSFSQSTRVTLNLKDARVEDVLMKIEEQSNLYFIYNRNVVDVNRVVNVSCTNQKVSEILNGIFSGTDVDYEIQDRHIILKSNSEQISQPKSLSGRVTDSSGSPLPGVTVVVKGSTSGTITDANGNYSLANVPADATISFSFIGLKTQEVTVAGKTSLNVRMQEENIAIDEVVAVGYGTQRRMEMTSSISSVKSDNFLKGSITDAAQLLKGKVAGLTIVTPDGNPTSTSQILLRGTGTLKAGTQPLIVIDGVPGSLNDVAAEDIESIDILKDGSAAAIYGTRGSNGVILITTKNVKGETPATIEYSGYVTTQSIAKRLEFMDGDDFRDLISQGKLPASSNGGANTNWLDEVLRKQSVSQTHNVSMKGGSANTNYIMNINYKALEGLMIKSDNNVLNLRIEANHTMLNGKLKINGNLTGYDRKYASNDFNEAYYYTQVFNPSDPVKDANGSWTEHKDRDMYYNPVSLLNETEGTTKQTNFRPYGSVSLFPVSGLTLKLAASYDVYTTSNGTFQTSNYIWNIKSGQSGAASRTGSRSAESLVEATANYTKSLDKHNFTILGGFSWDDYSYEDFYMQNYNFSSDQFTYNNMGNGTALAAGKASMRSSKNSSRLVGYFSRLNYNYADKYMLMASIRYEGSSKFGSDHKYGAFPSVSAGWNIINESFAGSLKSTFTALKIRGGYGITGTIPNDAYKSLAHLTFGGSDYYYLSNGQWTSIVFPKENANPDLRWEKKMETNIGLDFGILKNRVSGSFDWYKRTTKDLLWDYTVPTPPYLYTNIFANAGTIENKGVEIQINATPVQTSALIWNTSVNFSTNKNKVVSLSNDKFNMGTFFDQGDLINPLNSLKTHRIEEGKAVGNFYGYKTIDIDDNGYWIVEGKDGNPKSFADATPEDKKIIGNGLPKQYLSWNNTFTFKQFDLNVTMRGAFGYQVLNSTKMYLNVPNMLSASNLLKTAFDDIYGKRPLADDQAPYYLSHYLEDGDYWKIDNVTLGYTLNFKKGAFKNLRLYVSGSNLFTITGYSGLDPEVNSLGLYPGRDDLRRYPSTRTYTLGLSVKF